MISVDNWKQEAGKFPSKRALVEAGSLVRPSTKDCLVIAMALRPRGVTQYEVVSLLGKPHRNVIKRLVRSKKVKALVLPEFSRCRRIRLIVPRQI